MIYKRYFGDDADPTINAAGNPKVAYLHVPGIDLDLDSDNDSSTTSTRAEDMLEATPGTGKFVFVADGDVDEDGTRDVDDLDGIDGFGFEPMSLSLFANVSKALPSQMSLTLDYDPSLLRVCTRDAGDERSMSDMLTSGFTYSVGSLGLTPGGTLPLFVEAIKGSAASATIKAAVDVAGSIWSGLLVDEVRVQPRSANVDAATISANSEGNSRSGVLDKARKNTTGASVPVNDDDDNYSVGATDDGADWKEQVKVDLEDDLLPITLKAVAGANANDFLTLNVPGDNLKLWESADKATAIPADKKFPANADTTVFVEAKGLGNRTLRLDADFGGDVKRGVDTIKVSPFQWSGPLNVPEHTEYLYKATVPKAPEAAWIDPIGGSLTGEVNANKPLDRTIRWGDGPVIGRARLKVNNDYTWGLGVNVVGVDVKMEKGDFTKSQRNTFGSLDGGNTFVLISSQPKQGIEKPNKTQDFANAINWKAEVTLTGPGSDSARGLRQIKVGFGQSLKVNSASLLYSNGKRKQIPGIVIGGTYRDAIQNTLPFYDTSDGAIFDDATVDKRVETIASQDQPYLTGIPLLYNTSLPQGAKLQKVEANWDFDTRVIAATTDKRTLEPADTTPVSGHARMHWSWNGTGTMQYAAGNAVPTYDADAAADQHITIPQQWAPVDPIGSTPLFDQQPRFNNFFPFNAWANVEQ